MQKESAEWKSVRSIENVKHLSEIPGIVAKAGRQPSEASFEITNEATEVNTMQRRRQGIVFIFLKFFSA